jgi:hypothetical protein
MVLRSAGKVLSGGTSDEAATEEEDLLLLLVGGRNLQGIPAENWSNLFVILKQTPGKLGKDESGLVDVFVVVNSVGDLPHRSLEVPLLTLSTDHETDLTAGVSGDSSEGVFGTVKISPVDCFSSLINGVCNQRHSAWVDM